MVAKSRTEDATSAALVDRLVSATSGKNVLALAELLGVSSQAIYNAKNKGKIPKSWIIDVAEGTGASADWLLHGDPASKSAVELRGQSFGRHPDQLQFTPGAPRGIDQAAGEPQAVTGSPANGTTYVECVDCQLTMVPMVEARLSAGGGSFETGENAERRYAFRSDWISAKGQPSQMVLMRVAGDSMEPRISNNDVVLIDQSQTTPRAGDLYAVAVEDLVYLKVVDAVPGKLILKSYNGAYAALEIDARGDLADGIRIIGRAVWVGRELY